MLSATLTEGMSTIEVLTVFLASLATKRELRRLALFFSEFAK